MSTWRAAAGIGLRQPGNIRPGCTTPTRTAPHPSSAPMAAWSTPASHAIQPRSSGGCCSTSGRFHHSPAGISSSQRHVGGGGRAVGPGGVAVRPPASVLGRRRTRDSGRPWTSYVGERERERRARGAAADDLPASSGDGASSGNNGGSGEWGGAGVGKRGKAAAKSGAASGSGAAAQEAHTEGSCNFLKRKVPWNLGTMCEVMIIWLLAFWFLGHWLVPLGLECLGIGLEDLTARGQAVMHLVVDVSELCVTVGILWARLRQFKPRSLGLFPIKFRGNWIFMVLFACLSFPVVDWLALQSQNLLPNERDEWAASLEQSLSGGDMTTNILYFIVVSVCAPIWEEAIFRGFLLPSINKYLPTQGAILASSVCFAMAHFSVQRFIPLVALGFVMGTVYVRSKNLLSSILLHSLWNLYIFYQLAARGVM